MVHGMDLASSPAVCRLQGTAAERQMWMKAKLFLKNTVILTVGSIALRLIGVAFGAYLSRQIGAEGMGLYQLCLLYTSRCV